MKKRGKLIALVVIGITAAGILLLETAAGSSVTVRMTAESYEPSKITIQPGQKVIWKNTGQMERWPASNTHPTHEQYPSEKKGCLGSELDACKALKTGESYSFTFEKIGSWGMHDHLSPNDGMIITVTDSGSGWIGRLKMLWRNLFNPPTDTSNQTGESLRQLSYAQQHEALERIAKDDPRAAWNLLKDAFIVKGQVITDVHEFAHLIGHAAYEKQGIAGVAVCDDSFAYGCFHGVAEEAINSQGEQAISKIEQSCTDNLAEPKRPSCYHGIGHGTAGIHKHVLTPALAACGSMQPANQTYCHDGVFMEHAGAVSGAGIEKDNPWKLCEALIENYHISCARYQPIRLSNAGYDFAAGLITCSQTSIMSLSEHCARAYGFAAVGQGRFDAQQINELCSSAHDSLAADRCRIAAATELVFQSYVGWERNAPELCALISDSAAKSECDYTAKQTSNGGSE